LCYLLSQDIHVHLSYNYTLDLVTERDVPDQIVPGVAYTCALLA